MLRTSTVVENKMEEEATVLKYEIYRIHKKKLVHSSYQLLAKKTVLLY